MPNYIVNQTKKILFLKLYSSKLRYPIETWWLSFLERRLRARDMLNALAVTISFFLYTSPHTVTSLPYSIY